MLNYNQTVVKLKEISDKIKSLEDKTDAFEYKDSLKSFFEEGKTEEMERVKLEYAKNNDLKQVLRRCQIVYRSNSEKLYVLENIQTVIDVFNKYVGKKCGEKTRQKIVDEVRENGVGMYFNDTCIMFYTGLCGYNRTEVHTKYIDGERYMITDNDNKINELSLNMFNLPDEASVIDDVEQYVREKEAEFERLKAMYKELEEAVSNYNKNCPFRYQYIRDGISWMD